MNRTASYFLTPDDPRLTAYALGELEGEDHAWIAAAVAGSLELQAVVEEIRHAAAELSAALAAEPLPDVGPASILVHLNGNGRHAASAATGVLTAVPPPRAPRPVARMPSAARGATVTRLHRPAQPSYFGIMTLAAACFLVVMLVYERHHTAAEEAEAARAAEIAATERARAAAAAAARRAYVELDLRGFPYAMATTLSSGQREDTSYMPAEARPNSSFPIDVATTSYGDVMRAIAARQLPPVGSVRIEELVNTFAYNYPAPAAGDASPFAASLEAAEAPWAPAHRLVRIGLKGRSDPAGRQATIARNVSIVVQFNPETVRSYRLIGYEKSPLVAQEALSTGRVDAAEVRAGHAVTALYEVVPVSAAAGQLTDTAAETTRLLTVRIAYTRPDGLAARPLEFPLDDRGASFGDASGDFKFAAAVAGFGMILRQPGLNGTLTFGSIIAWAEQGVAHDETGRRREFVGLLRDASEVFR